MRLNMYASLEHYAEHLAPIWQALPDEMRGAAWSAHDGDWWGRPQAGLADASANPGPLLVASHGDAVSACAQGRDLIYVEHGAGQTYEGDPGAVGVAGWSGSRDRAMDRVLLFICPNETVAQRWRSIYDVPAIAVGCPKMDAWLGDDSVHTVNTRPSVAVTFHWDCGVVPEAMTAWPEYNVALAELATWAETNGVHLLGHGHPRIWPRLRRRWQALDVDPVARLGDVFAGADVLVADNTSAMYEFASLGRPVVALNASWYRRDVEHGLRFWSHVPGIQVNDPGELVHSVAAQLADRTLGEVERTRAVAAAYARTDGHAAERAAHAILEALQ